MNQKTKLGLRLAKQRGSSNSGAQLNIQQGRGGKLKIFRPLPKHFYGENMCIILNHGKTNLQIQNIFGAHFYIWGHSFQFGANLCGKTH